MEYKKPGDAGHSTFEPEKGDFRGDTLWYEDPLKAAGQAWSRFTGYGNWSGPDNKFHEKIVKKYKEAEAKGEKYDPSKDPEIGKDTAVDGLDAAAREHDLEYYRVNCDKGKDKGSMFLMDGLIRTADADRKLADSAEKEMAEPSVGKDGKPVEYSADTRRYAAGMQGFFGGRADGVKLRQEALDKNLGTDEVLVAAGEHVASAYKKNGAMGAVCETLGLANVAAAHEIKKFTQVWDDLTS